MIQSDIQDVVCGCSDISECTTLSSIFEYIIKYGPKSKENRWNGKQPLMILFRDNLKDCIEAIVNKNSEEKYHITCRSGYCGTWCNILFAAVLSRKYNLMLNNCSPSRGIYPCYLFAEDLSEIYLAYMIASGDKYENTLKRIVGQIRNLDVFSDYLTDTTTMLLGKDTHNYRLATICFKKYTIDDLNDETLLEADLLKMMRLHQKYGDKVFEIYNQSMTI